VKRDNELDIEGPTNFTLSDGTVHKVDRQVWLDITEEDVQVVHEETY
jgi:hypothetical protein